MQKVRQLIDLFGSTDEPVMITGETGVGKSLVARALHRCSRRKGVSIVEVCCPAIPSDLVESELFGHERGAFTGALRLQRGKAEIAQGGSLFLDEVGDFSPELQPKLLRFLDDGVFYRVGGIRPIRVNVRVIAATNRDLDEAMADGRFRADLFFRIATLCIDIPPLRQRPDDIPLLTQSVLTQLGRKYRRQIPGVSSGALNRLMGYDWPGNVRELYSVLTRAFVTCHGESIEERDLTDFRENGAAETGASAKHLRKILESSENRQIQGMVKIVDWLERRHGRSHRAHVRQALCADDEAKTRNFNRCVEALTEQGIIFMWINLKL